MSTEFIEYNLADYKKEFGDRRFRKLNSEINEAKRFKKFIEISLDQILLPNPADFYNCILNNIKYSFAGKTKLIVLALLLLKKWNEEVNNKYDLLNENDLDMFAYKLIEKGHTLGV